MTAQQAFDDHHRAVYRFLYRLTNSAHLAEDITQDCFLAFLRHPDRWDPARGDVKTYLFSIARNLAYKHYRDLREDVSPTDDTFILIPDYRDQELAATISQLISQLPDLQRETLILFEYEGFHLHEIATIVNVDLTAVKARLHRARERLKRALAPCKKLEAHNHAH